VELEDKKERRKSMNWLKLLDFIGILDKLVSSISEELRKGIVQGLKEARAKAEKTDNKYDDILMFFLCAIFHVDEE
jgi:hypothetical protein